ncbi:MAG TPA: hypothetical protein ENF52_02055 [Chloroflexi bacterium]|nr:hypothetical protein [Chloroflexota bacterium]
MTNTHPPTMTTVHVEHGMLRAQAIKAKLEEAGIPVLLQYESAGPIIGITINGLGEVRINVPADLADEARHLLEPSPSPQKFDEAVDSE